MPRRIAIALALTIVVSTLVLSAAGKPPSGSALGAGTVFLPNPVADLGDETLTDQKDADYPALAPAYHDVVLTHLDGSGFLVGDWANRNSLTSDEHSRLRGVLVSLFVGATIGAWLLLHAPAYAPVFPLAVTALVVATAARTFQHRDEAAESVTAKSAA